MQLRVAAAILTLIVAAFLFLHLHRMAEVSVTWDEGGDMATVECIQKTGNPFACLSDISQTRLPFLIHAAVGGPAWENRNRSHYPVSLVFSLMTLAVITAFAWAVYGPGVSTLTAALYVSSIQILASGRMLLSHSSIIFCFFSTLSFASVLLFARGGKRRCLILCAVAYGASVASSVVALFNGLAIAAIYIVSRRFAWRDVFFFPLAVATFFASSVIYTQPANLRALVDACIHLEGFANWNYLDTGSRYAPWWFPLLLLVVKIGPWWLVLAAACAVRSRPDRYLAAFLSAFAVNLLLKGTVFQYETPHHQVQWYPFLLLAVAVVVVNAWSRPVMAAVAVCLTLQVVDVVRFFPHFLFYGSQYGDRFVGEFYGPAVMHAQGRDPINRAVDKILLEKPAARILVADNNILGRNDPRVVPFTKRDPSTTYKYAFIDRLYGMHYRFPERDAYNAMLARDYEPHYTYYFPPRMWVYRIMRRRY